MEVNDNDNGRDNRNYVYDDGCDVYTDQRILHSFREVPSMKLELHKYRTVWNLAENVSARHRAEFLVVNLPNRAFLERNDAEYYTVQC